MRIIGRPTPINVIMYHPNTAEGKEELARRLADVHADAVNYKLQHLNCPTRQKLELLDAVIETVKQRSREQEG